MEELENMAQIQQDGAFWIWVCIAIVILAAIGWNGFRKLRAFNRKHNIISYDTHEVGFYDDDDDENYTISE